MSKHGIRNLDGKLEYIGETEEWLQTLVNSVTERDFTDKEELSETVQEIKDTLDELEYEWEQAEKIRDELKSSKVAEEVVGFEDMSPEDQMEILEEEGN